jgi:uncharacterized caspase-like protein
MVNYTHISPEGKITESVVTSSEASRMIGDRVLIGFNVVQRFFYTPDSEATSVTYFQSDATGAVWAIYTEGAR